MQVAKKSGRQFIRHFVESLEYPETGSGKGVISLFEKRNDPFSGSAMPISSRLDLPPSTSLLAQHCLLII